ncbi:TPA: hypothetical protein ACFP4Y_001263 [Neisseria bacilliformis]
MFFAKNTAARLNVNTPQPATTAIWTHRPSEKGRLKTQYRFQTASPADVGCMAQPRTRSLRESANRTTGATKGRLKNGFDRTETLFFRRPLNNKNRMRGAATPCPTAFSDGRQAQIPPCRYNAAFTRPPPSP